MAPDHHNQHTKSLFKKHVCLNNYSASCKSPKIFLGSRKLYLGAKNLQKKLASLVRICHMVYDFQAGGFSPLINPLAINKSTKQWDSPLGDTHSLQGTTGCPIRAEKMLRKFWRRSIRLSSLGHIASGGPPPTLTPLTLWDWDDNFLSFA